MPRQVRKRMRKAVRPRAGSPAALATPPRQPKTRAKPARSMGPRGLSLGSVPGPVRVLFLDCDGTLTDGTIGFDGQGDSRTFFIRDGIALEWARDSGVLPVVISGRGSKAVEGRMRDLKLEHYLDIKDKVAVARRVLSREQVEWEQCAMVGDDLPDVPLMMKVGWPIAVADARPEVQRAAKTVVGSAGGRGAVRDVVEMVLRHNGTWDQVLERYEVR